MAEMVIPGTYIEVRSEGLISAGAVSTGIVGVIGTAMSGPVGQPVTLAGFADARDTFGSPDPFAQPDDGANPLTLVRALQYVYGNGASSVVAVRVASGSQASATYAVQNGAGQTVALLTAASPGTWANDVRVGVTRADEDCRIDGEVQTQGFDRLAYAPVVVTPENRIRVLRGITKRMDTLNIVYKPVVEEKVRLGANNQYALSHTPVEVVNEVNQVRILDSAGKEVRKYGEGAILYGAGDPPQAGEIRINTSTGVITFAANEGPVAPQVVDARYAAGHDAPADDQVLVTAWDGTLTFPANKAPRQQDGDQLLATYVVSRSDCAQVTLTYGQTVERYVAPDGRILANRISQSSRLVDATADPNHGADLPATAVQGYLGTGSNTSGNNGADATADDYAAGLETLANQLINIVVLAGQDADTMGSTLLEHLRATEQTDFERIGVIGAKGPTLAQALGQPMADGRVIVVAPGLVETDGAVLPAAYTAAAVAGLIASFPVQTSLTNKALAIPGLALDFNRGQQEQLIRGRVLTVARKDGFRVVKGLTSAGEGDPFAAIPTRRIVDYAKYGVRSAANPYIGRLNNVRVRSALRATLDAFLTRMVEDEALTGYALEVSATRAQEIAGEVSVVMTLQPTFSIDFIRVTMNLK